MMKIDIDYGENGNEPNNKYKLQPTFCFLSLCRFIALISTIFIIVCILILFKVYITLILLWLEKQETSIVLTTICCLFILVALPICIGYVVLVVATGYMFGFFKGILIVIFGANFGLLIAHNILKLIGNYKSIYRLTQNDIANSIMRVISGPLHFKIVLCSRLTPIPFGFQNTIFALSNVNNKVYHIASLFGLFPAQFVGVYIGSTLRSMQDVLENKHIASSTYIFISLQLLFGASLMIWIGAKARRELMKAIAEADGSTNTTKFPEYSYV